MQAIVRNKKELGEKIRSVRRKKGLRQIDLARKASVRQALISDLENGLTSARFETLIKVLAALDMDLAIINRRKAEFDPTVY